MKSSQSLLRETDDASVGKHLAVGRGIGCAFVYGLHRKVIGQLIHI